MSITVPEKSDIEVGIPVSSCNHKRAERYFKRKKFAIQKSQLSG